MDWCAVGVFDGRWHYCWCSCFVFGSSILNSGRCLVVTVEKWKRPHDNTKRGLGEARVCYPRNLTPRVGTRVWRADQVRARVGTRVSPHLVPERSGR